jgi:hypothetical protein
MVAASNRRRRQARCGSDRGRCGLLRGGVRRTEWRDACGSSTPGYAAIRFAILPFPFPSPIIGVARRCICAFFAVDNCGDGRQDYWAPGAFFAQFRRVAQALRAVSR